MPIIRKIQSLAVAAAAAVCAFTGAARAEDAPAFSWSTTLGATSDYIFRGISLNNEDPAAQGSIDMSYGIFYAGAWASNVDGAGFKPLELDLYAGIKPVLGTVTFDFGIIGYLYPVTSVDSLDYVEFKAAASTELVKSLNGTVTLYYTPDSDNYGETFTVEGTLGYTLPQIGMFTPTISGTVGYTEDSNNKGLFFDNTATTDDSYIYWNAGVAMAVEKFTFDFRYWDTDINQNVALAPGFSDSRFVFSLKVTLP
jgi:uncharacterized protein (TIGR02001 family)